MPKATTTSGTTTAKRVRRAVKPAARKRTAAPAPITHQQIALRAYELHLLGAGADPMDNWLRAERELVSA
ncbi:MAG: hypothetical protein QOH72_2734 [Solirubrobacteraceae bacterium]|jgi:hypothetical protein|nr:hypothetical protein [Solirubrobacteraceae bacterium]